MNILDYNYYHQHLLAEDEFFGFEGGYSGPPEHRHVKTRGRQTNVKSGFNEHSFTFPNGCKITVQENGEVLIEEQNGSSKKVRLEDGISAHIIK